MSQWLHWTENIGQICKREVVLITKNDVGCWTLCEGNALTVMDEQLALGYRIWSQWLQPPDKTHDPSQLPAKRMWKHFGEWIWISFPCMWSGNETSSITWLGAVLPPASTHSSHCRYGGEVRCTSVPGMHAIRGNLDHERGPREKYLAGLTRESRPQPLSFPRYPCGWHAWGAEWWPSNTAAYRSPSTWN